jgi:hypothetical protein
MGKPGQPLVATAEIARPGATDAFWGTVPGGRTIAESRFRRGATYLAWRQPISPGQRRAARLRR